MKGSRIFPNRNTYNILLKEAAEVVELIRANDMVPDIWTHNTIMRGLCDEGRSRRRLALRMIWRV
ncbi:hypothetical protein Ahy_B01g056004 isoform B [Arachis hypogaea]|uniref:Uncharacterized protein n=1 Tax=Arachis hypogaea TaxID=3818 RepID=A0A445AXP1_ARAHY|nr:hypothetical protein Ahy_B01g056001 isoform B [Arachis hypogaea]RYR31210.1 hypothetical protein Ahy_B01g056002 isoform B [Arachis hypogaea]RYR31212.1 hypothetical protein Ahy_B01g056003 isoform B [Arachis hypogaea]RYR31214.1 hypothetical protein Ahy_B01g056004 isoform B [Arachis hypogaea]